MKKILKNIATKLKIKDDIDFLRFKLNQTNSENRELQKKLRDTYEPFIKKGEWVFDVGGNIGNYSQAFSDLGGRVVSVEPNFTCYSFLKIRFRYNKGVFVVNKGLGERNEKKKLFLAESHTISSMSEDWIKSVRESGRFSNYKWDKSVEVEITTLDDLIKQYGAPAFCKIDVEGFEYNVLQGLSQKIKLLSIEHVPESFNNTEKCINHLNSLGKLQFNYLPGSEKSLSFETWKNTDEMFLFLNSMPKESIGDIFIKIN